ncbi:MAG TPA: hypothetical protein VE619_10305 [Nitrososphaeraceae archaeon]|nr:hypothetical protein [Nitrososphaeraceae archaeon]
MVVKIDLSYVPNNIQSIILDVIEKVVASQKQFADKIITLYNETNVQKIKEVLEEELRLNDVNDYVISENMQNENEMAILKKGDIEQLGIYVCIHCGMAFESEIQRVVHQRMHYL